MGNNGEASFVHVLETIADNKFILGDRFVEIGIGGPNLEATLSCIAMAQGELGHARLLYHWVFDLKGQGGKKQDVRHQTGKAFTGILGVSDWISLLGAACAINMGVYLVLEAVLAARYAEAAVKLNKLIKEQEEHIVYCKGWAVQLLHDQGAVPGKFRQAFDLSVQNVNEWLKKTENDAELIGGGYLKAQTNLSVAFEQEVSALLSQGMISHA